MFKTGKEMVFRTKDLTQKQNNTGTRIDALIKADVVKRLNAVLDDGTGQNAYKIERTRDKTSDILQMGMCIILEMVLRKRAEDQYGDKVWYLNPEQAIYNGITKYQAK